VIHSVAYLYHYDPTYFPSPNKFDPERWLSPDAHELDARMVTFSKGPRSCIGINLAHAELYLTLAHMVRRYEIDSFETTEKDMEWKDNFVVTTKGHLKVKVKKIED
jgi:cytochrome P450